MCAFIYKHLIIAVYLDTE